MMYYDWTIYYNINSLNLTGDTWHAPASRGLCVHSRWGKCLSKLASKSIEKSFRRANIPFEKHTLKNSLALKHKFKSIDLRRDDVTIVSLDIKYMYPQCRFKAVNAAVWYGTTHLTYLLSNKRRLASAWIS
jgi:hypothetical protein